MRWWRDLKWWWTKKRIDWATGGEPELPAQSDGSGVSD